MLPAPMESLRDRFETIGADGGGTSMFVQSVRRQTAPVKLLASEEVGWVRSLSLWCSMPW